MHLSFYVLQECTHIEMLMLIFFTTGPTFYGHLCLIDEVQHCWTCQKSVM